MRMKYRDVIFISVIVLLIITTIIPTLFLIICDDSKSSKDEFFDNKMVLEYQTSGFGSLEKSINLYKDGSTFLQKTDSNRRIITYYVKISAKELGNIQDELLDLGIFNLDYRYDSPDVESERSAYIYYQVIVGKKSMMCHDTTTYEDRPEMLQDILEYLGDLFDELRSRADEI